ncbi:MAG: OmpA family protein [Rubrivivax sp.]|nr:OmpA family protein [Rubrivivax sp.]
MNANREAAAQDGLGGQTRRTADIASRRLVRVKGDVAAPLAWHGLLPLLGLGAVLWFGVGPLATNEIEATLAREVRQVLNSRGHGWARADVSGQEVLLSGLPPDADARAGDEALRLARAATCSTWAGPKVCAVSVRGVFGPGTPAGAQAAASPGAAPAAALGPAATACEAAFAKLLSSSRIEFASGTATIDARSAALLGTLAETARGCPGRLLIEGHADNVGDPEANRRLSEARAAAVRDALLQRGVPATQLEALGFGASRPLADNANEAGRAANRRIDFKALP